MKEHDMVIFIKPILNIPLGTVGCIVHEYPEGKAFEVETEVDGGTQVCTVEPEYLASSSLCPTKGVRETLVKLIEMLKSGEITLEQIQEATQKVEEKSLNYKSNELWDADPNCDHEVVDAPGGGVKCTKCPGWFCL